MSQEVNLRRFFMDAKDRAEALLTQTHVGADAKTVIKDLLQVGQNFTDLMDHSAGQSADARMIKKKMEQVRMDAKAIETKFAAAKNVVIQLATEIEVISKEAKALKARVVMAHDPVAASVVRIEAALQQIVKAVVQISSL